MSLVCIINVNYSAPAMIQYNYLCLKITVFRCRFERYIISSEDILQLCWTLSWTTKKLKLFYLSQILQLLIAWIVCNPIESSFSNAPIARMNIVRWTIIIIHAELQAYGGGGNLV